MSVAVLHTASSPQEFAALLESRILDLLDEQAMLGLDCLVELLPEYHLESNLSERRVPCPTRFDCPFAGMDLITRCFPRTMQPDH